MKFKLATSDARVTLEQQSMSTNISRCPQRVTAISTHRSCDSRLMGLVIAQVPLLYRALFLFFICSQKKNAQHILWSERDSELCALLHQLCWYCIVTVTQFRHQRRSTVHELMFANFNQEWFFFYHILYYIFYYVESLSFFSLVFVLDLADGARIQNQKTHISDV